MDPVLQPVGLVVFFQCVKWITWLLVPSEHVVFKYLQFVFASIIIIIIIISLFEFLLVISENPIYCYLQKFSVCWMCFDC